MINSGIKFDRRNNMTLLKRTILYSTSAATIEIGIAATLYYQIYVRSYPRPEIGINSIFILILLLSLILSITIVVILHFTIFSRIQELKNYVNFIAETNNFEVDLKIKGNDEIAQFGKHVSKMIRVKNIAEKALRESEYLYKTIFETSEDSFIIIDKKLKPIHINKKFEKLFNVTFERIENKNLLDIINIIDDKIKFLDLLENVHEKPNKSSMQMSIQTENTSIIIVDALASPITIKEKPFVLLRLTDITEIKKMEIKTQEQQLQLQQADKLASLGMLVSVVAHEVNNPNSFIAFNLPHIEKIFYELLPLLDKQKEINPNLKIGNLNYDEFKADLRDLFADMKEGSNRITSIISELKNFVKNDSGVETQTIDLKDIFASALRLTNPAMKKKNPQFDIQLQEGFFISANRSKLGQVLLNLLNNALDAINEIDGKIQIKSYLDKEKNMICQISDNGCGIAEDKINFVFDPFFTTKNNSGGTGLGLSVSRSILKSMGFSINLESNLGTGTTVSIFIPKEFVK
jgi:PAS domain S-box-containing protein